MTIDWFIALPIESSIADVESPIANPYERRKKCAEALTKFW